MRRHYRITKSKTWKGYKLYDRTESKAKDGHYIEILDKLKEGLEEIVEIEKRVNLIRFDIRFKEEDEFVATGETTNKTVSNFFRILRRKIKAWKNKHGESRRIKNLFYVWVREESKAKREHYHCAIAFKAQRHRQVKIFDETEDEYLWVYKIITDAWKEASLIGDINFGSRIIDLETGEDQKQVNEFYFIDSKEEDRAEFREAYKGLSYLSKVATKENQPKHGRMYNFSRRIRPKGHQPLASHEQSKEAA